MSDDDRHLFGVHAAEHMHFDIASVVDGVMDDFCDLYPARPFTVEEWTTTTPEVWLPSAESVLEWMVERAADELIDEDCFDAYDRASKSEDVRAAMQSVIVLLTSKVGYRMAEKCIATHQVTFDEAGNPLVDGAPLYATRVASEATQ